MATMTDTSIEQLNSFLRGEISAVETYRQALNGIQAGTLRAALEECARSHERRVQSLRDTISRLGGQPANTSGPWGSFAKLVQGGATAFGEKAAIAALEEGEDHGLRDYKTDLTKLDSETRMLVESDLLPAQMQTHRTLSNLKHTLA